MIHVIYGDHAPFFDFCEHTCTFSKCCEKRQGKTLEESGKSPTRPPNVTMPARPYKDKGQGQGYISRLILCVSFAPENV